MGAGYVIKPTHLVQPGSSHFSDFRDYLVESGAIGETRLDAPGKSTGAHDYSRFETLSGPRRMSIAVGEGTIVAGHWGPAGELRRELREDGFCSRARIGTGLLTWPQRSMAA